MRLCCAQRQKKERRAKRKADAEAKRRGTHRRARAKNAGNYSGDRIFSSHHLGVILLTCTCWWTAEAMKEILGVVGAEQD
jgi:hypothetical protein